MVTGIYSASGYYFVYKYDFWLSTLENQNLLLLYISTKIIQESLYYDESFYLAIKSQYTWKPVTVFFLCLYVSNVCVSLSLSYNRLWINKRFTKLPPDTGVWVLWTGVLRASWQSCTSTFTNPKSSQMEGPLGLPMGLSVQNRARLQAKELVSWCDSKESHCLKYPILNWEYGKCCISPLLPG